MKELKHKMSAVGMDWMNLLNAMNTVYRLQHIKSVTAIDIHKIFIAIANIEDSLESLREELNRVNDSLEPQATKQKGEQVCN